MRAGPHSIVGDNLVVRSLRLWTPRDYEKGGGDLVINVGIQRHGEVAFLARYEQSGDSITGNTSFLMTGQNPLNYPLQKGDILIADWNTGPVAGVIVEFQLTRVGSVSEQVVESRDNVIGGRDIERPLFSAHAQDEQAVAGLARQINESGVPDVSIPIYLWDVGSGTPYLLSTVPEPSAPFAGGGAVEVVPFNVIVEDTSAESLYSPDGGVRPTTDDTIHIIDASVRLLGLAAKAHIALGIRVMHDDGQVFEFWDDEVQAESAGVDLEVGISGQFRVSSTMRYVVIIRITGDTNVAVATGGGNTRLTVTQLSSAFAPKGEAGEAGSPGPEGPRGASSFLLLDDTPSIYASHGGDSVKVNATEDGLEFLPGGSGAQALTDLTDTPAAYTGGGGKPVRVKNDETGVEFRDLSAFDVGADPVGSAAAVLVELDTHKADFVNPHHVDAPQVGADPAGSAAAVQSSLDTHKADVAAHIGEAPTDGKQYGRKSSAWSEIAPGAAPVASVFGRTGSVLALAADYASHYDPAGAAAAVQADFDAHEADLANPHDTDFIKLLDTPTSFAGAGGKVVTVNATEDGLEFATAGGGVPFIMGLATDSTIFNPIPSSPTITMSRTLSGLTPGRTYRIVANGFTVHDTVNALMQSGLSRFNFNGVGATSSQSPLWGANAAGVGSVNEAIDVVADSGGNITVAIEEWTGLSSVGYRSTQRGFILHYWAI